MTFLDITIIVVLVAFLAAAYFLFFYQDSPLKKLRGKNWNQDKASAQAKKIAQNFVRSKGGKIIYPANIAKDGKFADADFIIVGYYGVTAVKCIGLGGEIYGSKQEETWLQVLNDKTRNSIANPLLSLDQEARVVRDTLFEAKIRNVNVELVAVFTNTKAQIAVGQSAGYFTLKTFKKMFLKDKYVQDKNVDVDATVAAIEKWVVQDVAK